MQIKFNKTGSSIKHMQRAAHLPSFPRMAILLETPFLPNVSIHLYHWGGPHGICKIHAEAWGENRTYILFSTHCELERIHDAVSKMKWWFVPLPVKKKNLFIMCNNLLVVLLKMMYKVSTDSNLNHFLSMVSNKSVMFHCFLFFWNVEFLKTDSRTQLITFPLFVWWMDKKCQK